MASDKSDKSDKAQQVHAKALAVFGDLEPGTVVRLDSGEVACVGRADEGGEGGRKVAYNLERMMDIAADAQVAVVATPDDLGSIYAFFPHVRRAHEVATRVMRLADEFTRREDFGIASSREEIAREVERFVAEIIEITKQA